MGIAFLVFVLPYSLVDVVLRICTMELPMGVEPTTWSLQNYCTTIVLRKHKEAIRLVRPGATRLIVKVIILIGGSSQPIRGSPVRGCTTVFLSSETAKRSLLHREGVGLTKSDGGGYGNRTRVPELMRLVRKPTSYPLSFPYFSYIYYNESS